MPHIIGLQVSIIRTPKCHRKMLFGKIRTYLGDVFQYHIGPVDDEMEARAKRSSENRRRVYQKYLKDADFGNYMRGE